jgi:hypothetical protein
MYCSGRRIHGERWQAIRESLQETSPALTVRFRWNSKDLLNTTFYGVGICEDGR